MALTQNFHVISVLKRHKETVYGTNPELSCDICVEETQRDCLRDTKGLALTQNFHVISVLKRHKEAVHGTYPELSCDICVEEIQRDFPWH